MNGFGSGAGDWLIVVRAIQGVGAALMVRGRQGIAPTPAGRTLLQHARLILRQG